jgi:glycosyltransferase involved in cell wall biosynthesis
MSSRENTIPVISIIMPTYNRAGLIMDSIESVRKQTFTNWELIIVDDGSDDNTEEIVGKLEDKRIQFIKAGRIGVGGKIKNIGLQQAKGELIAFIDSDDLWATTKLEKQVDALCRYPEAAFCLTSGYTFEDITQPQKYFYKQQNGERVADIFLSLFNSEIAGYAQVLLFRKSCLAVAGNFREVKPFSDIDFIASLASHFKAVILFEPLVYRRLHDSNYITDNWERSYNDGVELIETYRTKLPSANVRNALFKLYINFGEKSLLYKKYFKALSKFFKSWQYKPFSIVPIKKIAKTCLYSLKGK